MKNFLSKVMIILIIAIVGIAIGYVTMNNFGRVKDYKIKFEEKIVKLEPGDTYELIAKSEVDENTKMVFESTNPEVVSVDEDSGIITAKNTGEAEITVRSLENNYINDRCQIIVTGEKVKIEMNNEEFSLSVSGNKKLKVISDDKKISEQVTWASSNPEVVTVDSNGNVKAVGTGSAVIVAETPYGTTAKSKIKVISKPIVEKKITLNKTSLDMNVGDFDIIKATLTPNNTTNTDIKWETSNPKVVTVNDEGHIIATGEGEATITATSVTGKIATCNIKVSIQKITKFSLNKQSTTINVGASEKLTVVIEPYDGAHRAITWLSSNPSVASVVKGNIVGNKVGTAKITVIASTGEKATCDVKVVEPMIAVTGVTLDREIATINVGSTLKVIASVLPIDATNKAVMFYSSKPSVATVDGSGNIKAISAGTTIITVITSDSAKNASMILKVLNPKISVTGVTLKSNTTINIGSSETLLAEVSPSNATNKAVTWMSSNTNVVTVDSNGKITGLKAGTATITATTVDGKKTATCVVSVIVPQTEVTKKQVEVKFVIQDKNATSTKNLSKTCYIYSYETSCSIIAPELEANSGYKAIGWSLNQDDISNTVLGSQIIKVSENKTYYSITYDTKALKGEFIVLDKNATITNSSNVECYKYNGSSNCTIMSPKLTAIGDYVVYGWSQTKNATKATIKENSKLNISKNVTYYSVTSRVVTITFDPNRTFDNNTVGVGSKEYSFKKTNIAPTSMGYSETTCTSYNGQGCRIRNIPAIVSNGNEVNGFSLTYDGSLIEKNTLFKEDTTLYLRIYNDKGKGILKTRFLKKIGNVRIEAENNISDKLINECITYLEDLNNNMPEIFFAKAKLFLVSKSTYIEIHNDTSSGFTTSTLYPKVFMKITSTVGNATKRSMTHELGHVFEQWYNFKLNTNLRESSEVNALYKKYVNKTDRPMRDYSYNSVGEFVAEMIKYYYIEKYSPDIIDDDRNLPSDIKEWVQNKICVAKNSYKLSACK